MVTIAVVALLMVGAAGSVQANQLEKGDKEINFNVSYTDISPDVGDSLKTTQIDGRFGYLLTHAHEVGFMLDYMKIEDGSSADASIYGVFYHYNFRAGETMNPYVGAQVYAFGGDLGDVYDTSYGLQAGIKVYPWDHAGFNFGLSWDTLNGKDAFGDGDQTKLFGGVLVKW